MPTSGTIYAANQGPADTTPASSKAGDEKLLDKIRKRHRYHTQAWLKIRAEGARDIIALTPQGPWDPQDRVERKEAGRPCIHLDQLGQYVNGFMGEVRQNPIAIDVDPAGAGANDKTAELRGDRIRRIEYDSHGTQATMTALENAAERSYGVFGAIIEYASWDSDELKIRFRRFANPDAVSWDPDCKEADCSDMQDAFYHDWMPWDAFKEEFGEDAVPSGGWADGVAIAPDWINNDGQMVQVSEYWCIEKKDTEVLWVQDPAFSKGKKYFKDALPKGYKVDGDRLASPDGLSAPILRRRKTKRPQVMFYLTNGISILERSKQPGTQIPIFPVIGKERFIPTVDEDSGATTVQRVLFSYMVNKRTVSSY
jgi:hypothetical protein